MPPAPVPPHGDIGGNDDGHDFPPDWPLPDVAAAQPQLTTAIPMQPLPNANDPAHHPRRHSQPVVMSRLPSMSAAAPATIGGNGGARTPSHIPHHHHYHHFSADENDAGSARRASIASAPAVAAPVISPQSVSWGPGPDLHGPSQQEQPNTRGPMRPPSAWDSEADSASTPYLPPTASPGTTGAAGLRRLQPPLLPLSRTETQDPQWRLLRSGDDLLGSAGAEDDRNSVARRFFPWLARRTTRVRRRVDAEGSPHHHHHQYQHHDPLDANGGVVGAGIPPMTIVAPTASASGTPSRAPSTRQRHGLPRAPTVAILGLATDSPGTLSHPTRDDNGNPDHNNSQTGMLRATSTSFTSAAVAAAAANVPTDLSEVPDAAEPTKRSLHGLRSRLALALYTRPSLVYAGYNGARAAMAHARAEARKEPMPWTIDALVERGVHRPRRAVMSYLRNSNAVKALLILVEVSVDLGLVIMYLVEMSLVGKRLNDEAPPDTHLPGFLYVPRPHWLYLVVVGLSMLNALSLLLRVSFAEFPLRSFLAPTGIIDLVTTVPMMVSIVLRGGPFLYVPYYLRSISVLPRIRRFMHLRTEISYGAIPQDILQQRLVILIATLLTIIYVQMCSVQYAEAMSKEQYLTLMDSLYFTVVTLTTVGYGDISAASVAGRIIVMLGIIFAFIAIPPLVSSALDTYRTRREGGGSYKERNSIPHVVVMGRFDNLSLVHALLTAFFNNESAIPVKVVMLSRHNPSIDVKAMINAPKYSNTVFYIRGSALNEEDLCRAKVRTSLGVFFISDNTWTEDERNVLRVWSVARHAPSVELYVYTHRPAFQRYHTHHATAVVCADDLKQALVASNCLHPGISTLVANLITNSEPLELYHKPWHAQYGDGMGHEIYNLQIVPVFVGKRFHHICAYLFREFQVISIAVRIPVVHHDLDYETLDFHVVLNPAESYVFCGNEEIVCIAQGIRDLTRIQKLTQETFTRSLQNRDPIFSVYPDYQSFPSRPLEHIRALGIDWANPPPAYAIPPVSIPGGRPDGPMRIGFPEAPFSADSKKVPLCHLLVNPPSSAMDCEVYDATGSSGGTELTDHYVIITPSWMFFRLLCTLRSSHLPAKDLKPILFFAKDIPHSDAFHYSRSFPLVYFMRGNPRHRRDLIRANLAAAARIVILAPEPSLDPSPAMTGGAEPTAVPVPDNPGDEDFTDLDPILNRHQAVHLVARHGRDPVYTMVVLNDAAAIRFLGVSSQGAAATAMRAAAAAVSATVVTSDSTFRAESRPIYPSAYAAAPPADSVPNVIYSQYEPAAYVQAPPPRPLAPPPPATAAAAASAEVRHPRSTSPMPHGSRSSSPPFMSGTGTNGSSAADRARRLASPNLLASHAAASQRGGPAPPPPTIVNTAPTLERPMPRGRNVRPLSSVGVKYPTDPQPTALQPAMGRSISAQSLLHNPARSESEPMPHSTSGSAGGGTTDPMLVSSTSGGASVFGDAAADRSEAVHPPVPEYSGGHGHGSIGGTSFLAADPAALGGALHIPLQSSIGSISEGTMPRRRRVRRRRQETVITAGGESPGSGLLSPAGPMPVLPAGAAVAAAAGLVSPISPGASGGGDLPTDRVAGLMSEEENLGLQIGFPPPPKRVQMLYDPLFASGEAFCADSLDTILIQHFFNPTILDVVRLFSGVRSRTDISLDKQLNVLPSYFYTEPVPKAFVGKTFQSLFTHFILTRGIVSIGLYRGPSTDLQNSHSFVYTAPHPDVTLKANDSVYILTRLWRPERYPMGGADSDSEEPSGFAGGGGSGHASQRQQQQQQQQDPPVGVSPVLSHGGDTLAM